MATYYELITDEVLSSHNGLQADADRWGTDTLARMDALAAQASSQLGALSALDFDPDFVGLSLDFIAPGGTKPSFATQPDYSAEGPEALDLVDLGSTPVTAFAYTEERYEQQLKNKMFDQLKVAIDGEAPFLPSAVFDAMYDRAVADLQAQYVADQWSATDRGASLGWELASETTLGGMAAADDAYSTKLALAKMTAFVKEWTLKHEDMWKGMGQGTQFEDLWIKEHNTYHGRLLSAAQASVDKAIDINKDLLQRNQDDIAAYVAQWDGFAKRVGSEVSMFQALISNVGTTIASEQARFAYEGKQVDKAMDVTSGETGLRVEDAKLTVENSLGTLTKLAELSANVSMALMSASDVSLGTGTSFGTSESHSYAEKCCDE